MKWSSSSTLRSGAANASKGSPETLLRLVTTETSRQILDRGSDDEDLQNALTKDRILRLLMKEEENRNDTVVSAEDWPIAVQGNTSA